MEPSATSPHASTSSNNPTTISNLPVYAYVGIGIGGLLLLGLIATLWRKYTKNPTPVVPIGLVSYPPNSPYRCRHCGSTHLEYRIVQPGNRLGNDGRPYYVCVNANCPNVMRTNPAQHERGWVTWHDNWGVALGNPLCWCKLSAREDTAGPGRRFWTCSTGACGYNSWREDGKEIWGNGF